MSECGSELGRGLADAHAGCQSLADALFHPILDFEGGQGAFRSLQQAPGKHPG